MLFIKAAYAAIAGKAYRLSAKAVPAPADKMPQRVAGKGVAGKQAGVYQKDEGSHPDAKMAVEVEGYDNIPPKENEEDQRRVKEITVNVLCNERPSVLARKALSRLADAASGRIGPKSLVVRATVVVARKSKQRREGKNEKRRRERQPMGKPSWPVRNYFR